jgi:hypothetical protein
VVVLDLDDDGDDDADDDDDDDDDCELASHLGDEQYFVPSNKQ